MAALRRLSNVPMNALSSSKNNAITTDGSRIFRGSDELGEVEVTNLKRGPADAKEIIEGEMCGMNLKTTSKILLEEGDRIEVFRRETVNRKL